MRRPDHFRLRTGECGGLGSRPGCAHLRSPFLAVLASVNPAGLPLQPLPPCCSLVVRIPEPSSASARNSPSCRDSSSQALTESFPALPHGFVRNVRLDAPTRLGFDPDAVSTSELLVPTSGAYHAGGVIE